MGGGLALLALTRPFEGLLVSIPAGCVLLGWVLRRPRPAPPVWLSRVAAPIFLALAVWAGFQTYYNYRVTGDAFTMPYQVHMQQYEVVPHFIFLPLGDRPEYRNPQMRECHVDERLDLYHRQKESMVPRVKFSLGHLRFYLGPAWILCLAAAPWVALRRPWMGLAVTALALVSAGYLATISLGLHPHYVAPAAPLLYVFVVECLRWIRAGRPFGRRWGHGLATALVLLSVGSFILSLIGLARRGGPGQQFAQRRQQIEQELRRRPGKDLVVVRYGPGHSHHREYVFNRADIDASEVVWARDMSNNSAVPEGNRPLLEYFSGRRVWLLEAENETAKLRPWNAANGAAGERP